MEEWLTKIEIGMHEFEPHPKLRPLIRSYTYEKYFLYIEFTETLHFRTFWWIRNFFYDIAIYLDSIPFNIDCVPRAGHVWAPQPSLFDQLTQVTKFTGLKNTPCFSGRPNKQLKFIRAALHTDALKIIQKLNKKKFMKLFKFK